MAATQEFLKQARQIAFNQQHRHTIRFNMSKYDASVQRNTQRYNHLEEARRRAANIKRNALNQWDIYLKQFEENITQRGAQVFWTRTGGELMQGIVNILKDAGAKMLVKSKSMLSEEVDFNETAEQAGIESLETDLGEFIVQVAGEKPYHIVTPAMHKSRHDVAKLFNRIFDTPEGSTPEFLTDFVRRFLRKKFVAADAGVTGANFLIADTGAVAVTENEGNAVMSVAFPKIHIVIAGIEKIIPSLNDLAHLWPLLSHHGTGQAITVYNSIFTGPRQPGETDGPEKMYIFLLDNGRTQLNQANDQRIALSCIRCGACLNACPVYRNIGGYTYNATYSGPIGSVITPFYNGLKENKHLSYACSLCGKCTENCPVKIPLHRLLLYNRRDAVQKKHSPVAERIAMQGMKVVLGNRRLLDAAPAAVKNMAFSLGGKKLWGSKRQLPVFQKSFSQQWRKQNKSTT